MGYGGIGIRKSRVTHRPLVTADEPTLFLLLATLTLVDMLVPDVIPFLDEIGLALLTIILGMWRDRRNESLHPNPMTRPVP
jgi:hypothetical protein